MRAWLSPQEIGRASSASSFERVCSFHYEATRLDIVGSYGAQYGTYRRGDFYDWHKDEFDMPYSDLSPSPLIGLNRKLSLVINPTDPRRYRGGDLLLKDTFGNVLTVDGLRTRGSVIVFPSSVLHMHIASAVTRGVRQSLVAWILGPSLR